MPTPQVTPKRFAEGRTVSQWLAYVGSPENLSRLTYTGGVRGDMSARIRSWYERHQLNDHQKAALKQLAALPEGPTKLLIIGECWSSDCRRDMPTLAHIGEAAGMEVRIFNRDSPQGKEPSASDTSDAAGNGDLMHQFLNRKNGGVFQSVPVGVFFTKDMRYIYHFTEYSALYQKDSFTARLRQRRPGESDAAHQERSGKAFTDLQTSPFFHVWACAAADEVITNLWERVVLPPAL